MQAFQNSRYDFRLDVAPTFANKLVEQIEAAPPDGLVGIVNTPANSQRLNLIYSTIVLTSNQA